MHFVPPLAAPLPHMPTYVSSISPVLSQLDILPLFPFFNPPLLSVQSHRSDELGNIAEIKQTFANQSEFREMKQVQEKQ
jgi:hypothetical protein